MRRLHEIGSGHGPRGRLWLLLGPYSPRCTAEMWRGHISERSSRKVRSRGGMGPRPCLLHTLRSLVGLRRLAVLLSADAGDCGAWRAADSQGGAPGHHSCPRMLLGKLALSSLADDSRGSLSAGCPLSMASARLGPPLSIVLRLVAPVTTTRTQPPAVLVGTRDSREPNSGPLPEQNSSLGPGDEDQEWGKAPLPVPWPSRHWCSRGCEKDAELSFS